MTKKSLLLASTLALAACSTTTRVATDYDHGAPFSSFHRFILITRPHPGTPNPLALQHTYDAVREELTRKGFEYVTDPAEADFAVDFTLSARDKLDVRSSPSPYGGPWLHAGWGSGLDVRQYEEGTLAIEMFDARSRRAVWHGSAKRELSESDVDRSYTVIRESVTAVLAEFPPTATK